MAKIVVGLSNITQPLLFYPGLGPGVLFPILVIFFSGLPFSHFGSLIPCLTVTRFFSWEQYLLSLPSRMVFQTEEHCFVRTVLYMRRGECRSTTTNLLQFIVVVSLYGPANSTVLFADDKKTIHTNTEQVPLCGC
jgi:hypothetical protein